MISYTVPVRRYVVQVLTYTFKDQNKNIIDLTGYTNAILETKLQGQIYSTIAATFVSPRNTGQVTIQTFFSLVGIWIAQFLVSDSLSNPVYGEPIQFTVVPNTEDLSLSQLPNY